MTTTKQITTTIQKIDNLEWMIDSGHFNPKFLITCLHDIREDVVKLRQTVEDFARDMISDSIQATEGGYEFDDDSWDANLDTGKELLKSLGLPADAIYNQLYLEIIDEDHPDSKDDGDDATDLGAQLQEQQPVA